MAANDSDRLLYNEMSCNLAGYVLTCLCDRLASVHSQT